MGWRCCRDLECVDLEIDCALRHVVVKALSRLGPRPQTAPLGTVKDGAANYLSLCRGHSVI